MPSSGRPAALFDARMAKLLTTLNSPHHGCGCTAHCADVALCVHVVKYVID